MQPAMATLVVVLLLVSESMGYWRHRHGSVSHGQLEHLRAPLPDEHPISAILRRHPSIHECHGCPAGTGVTRLCDNGQPTECSSCEPDQYSPDGPHFETCTPCSQCAYGLYARSECSLTRDTVCDSCSAVLPHINEDYQRKCLEFDDRSSGEDAERQADKAAQAMVDDDITMNAWQVDKQRQSLLDDNGPRVELPGKTFWRFGHAMAPTHDRFEQRATPLLGEDDVQLKQEMVSSERQFKSAVHSAYLRVLIHRWTIVATMTLLCLLGCFLYSCRRQAIRHNNNLPYVHLTDEDNKVLSDCAAHLKNDDSSVGWHKQTLWWDAQGKPVNAAAFTNPMDEYFDNKATVHNL